MAVKTRLLFILLALLAAAMPALAQDEAPSASSAPVRVDGRVIFYVGPSEDISAAARAEQIEKRLESLLEDSTAIAPAVIEESGPDTRLITIGGSTIVTVTTTDAEDNVTDIDTLAAEWAGAIDTALQRGIERRQTGRWSVVVLIDSAFARLLESLRTTLPRILAALFVLALFGLIALLVRGLMQRGFGRVDYDLTSENLIKQLIYYGIWMLGIIVAVSALGFDPQALATAIGLTSVALGFALKDVLSNFVSGLLLLVMRPFKLGDQIVVGETEGAVEGIELRVTRIRTYDGRVVLVPNGELFTSRVTNNTAAPLRRASVMIYLTYKDDLARAMALALAAARGTEGVLQEPPPSALVRDLEPTDVALELRFWTDSRRSDFLATRSRVSEATVAALRDVGVGLPDPAKTTIVIDHD